MRKTIYAITYAVMTAVLSVLTACSDHDLPLSPDGPGQITADVDEIHLPIRAAYHQVKVDAANGIPAGVKVTSDQSWIELIADTVSADGYVEIYVERNEDAVGRHGSMTIGDPADGGVKIPVYQCGPEDEDSNGGLVCYAGCGYNIFNEINSETSICSPVIDFNRATGIDPMIVQTAARNIQDVKTITSNSLAEMSELMTHSVEKKSSGLKGGKKTIMRFEDQTEKTKVDETGFAYINFQRISACSSLDVSKVMYYLENGNLDILTPEFRKQYDIIIANPTPENVFKLFKDFGTHIVSYVDLGGSMDIAISFNKTMIGTLNMRADDFRQYFFNSEPSDYTLNNQIQGLSTSVSNKGSFKIAGGTRASRDEIIRDCRTMGHINSDHIYQWTQTLPKRDFMTPEALALLSPVNVQLVPIWSLFPQRLANLFFECAIQESQKSTNAIDDAKAGLDNYGFKISDADFMKFKDDDNESLVRVVYANQTTFNALSPVLEICNEYVPVLEGNKRVTIIYPIRHGRPFHGTGLYPGDGKGRGPAWLTFSEGDVYVQPIKGTESFTQIDSVYYLHGNIYLTSLGLDLHRNFKMRWKAKGILDLPIVKIGSGYWTRRNIDQSIGSGVAVGSKFRYREFKADNNEIWVNVKSRLNNPPQGIGDAIDDVYGEPTKWYFPMDKDRIHMQKYIGYETRHLLKGQLSGFDAQFEGFYGPGGVDNVGEGQNDYHNSDKCYLIFKTDRSSDTGSAIRLDGNYELKAVSLGTGNNNFFPLRLFRSSYYYYDYYKNCKYEDYWRFHLW